MNKETAESTGKYYSDLMTKVTKIEKNTKRNRIRRIIMLIIVVVISIVGVYYGKASKDSELQTQYEEFKETRDINCLTTELMSYKDAYSIFEKEFLGNSPYQSIMGGFFYYSDECSVYPDDKAKTTLLYKNGEEIKLCNFIADNINVKKTSVFYRDPSSRKMYIYDTDSKNTISLDIKDVIQFIVCGDEYYYIESHNRALVHYNTITQKSNDIVSKEVNSFVLAGNSIIYLDEDHILKEYDVETKSEKAIAQNIVSFSYNGVLWFQNDNTVYKKELNDKTITKIEAIENCNRLLGVTASEEFFESENNVYYHNLNGNNKIKTDGSIFIAAANNKLLLFCIEENCYKLIAY